MRYISTRGPGAPQSFADVLLSGLAPDGGLYVPAQWPEPDPAALKSLKGKSYAETAFHVMKPFVGDSIGENDLRAIIGQTYNAGSFDSADIAPLVKIAPDLWLLELFHGPSYSFKDYALQLLGRLFDHVLARQNKRITIVGATSGDTGSAAIAACRGRNNIDIFILHPRGRVSEVQRRQMTTIKDSNIHNIALEGTFDDCQTIVKELFADEKLRADINMSAINSINWARIMAQIVYYVHASITLDGFTRPVSFAVPTGNFGNVFAAWAARRMGAPIGNLVIGSNRNDILTRFFESGEMKKLWVSPTLSPSMDIQISSNFERYLFGLLGCDHSALKKCMDDFSKKKTFTVDESLMNAARTDFSAYRCTDDQTIAAMRKCRKEYGVMIDPHTAVGLHAAEKHLLKNPGGLPMIIVSTAHPAKFPDAVRKATGFAPPVPDALENVMKKPEHFTPISNNLD
ncbi:MAG: threonine synthase, partial [Proteobacteria bacterium]|nr:threonine synthase [Pseudomonadota bacterium]